MFDFRIRFRNRRRRRHRRRLRCNYCELLKMARGLLPKIIRGRGQRVPYLPVPACTELEVFRVGCLYIGTDTPHVLEDPVSLGSQTGRYSATRARADSRFFIILSLLTMRNATSYTRNYASIEETNANKSLSHSEVNRSTEFLFQISNFNTKIHDL